jgi:5-methyltetrahydrofolate--homocysteine methyltransferase
MGFCGRTRTDLGPSHTSRNRWERPMSWQSAAAGLELPWPGVRVVRSREGRKRAKESSAMTDVLETIREKCVSGDSDGLREEVKRALAAGVDAKALMTEALIPAMSIVGQKYSTGEFFLPQMMLGARAMSQSLEVLKPYLAQGSYAHKAKVVLGTVAGDFHDIGKNIVKMMLEGGGYEVFDLGVDVSPETFLDAVRDEEPRFVLLSALLTLTMASMSRTVEVLESSGARNHVLIGIGGAPVTQEFADEIGADFYGSDAYDCVEKCNQLLSSVVPREARG